VARGRRARLGVDEHVARDRALRVTPKARQAALNHCAHHASRAHAAQRGSARGAARGAARWPSSRPRRGGHAAATPGRGQGQGTPRRAHARWAPRAGAGMPRRATAGCAGRGPGPRALRGTEVGEPRQAGERTTPRGVEAGPPRGRVPPRRARAP
jgi:hypothetical protein